MAIPAGQLPQIGQGIPGGANGLPTVGDTPLGGVGGLPINDAALPRIGAGGVNASPLPLLGGQSVAPPPAPSNSLIASPKAHDLAGAIAILDRVHSGSLSWESAQKALSQGFSGFERDALKHYASKTYGPQSIDALRALGVTDPTDYGKHNVLSNLAGDISSTITGTPAALWRAGGEIAHDAKVNATHPTYPWDPPKSSTFTQGTVIPAAKGIEQEYAPLAHGDVAGFYHQFHTHPLGPILDALSVASAGVGTAARVGAISRTLKASEITRPVEGAALGSFPKGATAVVGQGADLSLSIHPLKNGLWQIRDRGKIVASRFPDENTAIAHAQSLTTGGVAPEALKAELTKTPTLDLPIPTDEVGHPLNWWKPSEMYDISGGTEGKGVYSIAAVRDPSTGQVYSTVGNHEMMSEALEKTMGDKAWDLPQFRALVNSDGKVLQVNEGDDGNNIGDASIEDDKRAVTKNIEDKFQQAKSLPDYQEPGTKPLPKPGYQPTAPASRGSLAASAGLRGGTQGNLIQAYERARGITHETETLQIMDEVAHVMDSPNLRMSRRSLKEIAKDVASDLRATRAAGVAKPIQSAADLPGFIAPSSTGRVLSTAGTALRESSDLVRAGAIYLRPAYLPNNWAGNSFMNLVQQGVFAPINLAKSLVMDKYIGQRYTRAIDQAMGTNAAESVVGTGIRDSAITDPANAADHAEGIEIPNERPPGSPRGYVASVTRPAAHVMGAIADQPFRRAAWLHEARRRGYRTMSDVQGLLDTASRYADTAKGSTALSEVADIGRAASEEIVKFGHMNDVERSVLRNLVFVYSWMRGAARYGARFPFAHPIQAATYAHMAPEGNKWLDQQMGGVPNFLVGAIPVGHDSKGNPILINPFSLNPLGTALQIGQAAAGTLDVLRDPKSFDKYAQNDIVSLTNPLVQSYLEAREGGKSVQSQDEHSVAAYRLYNQLQHPGSGSIYPTTREEAIGSFVGGSLFPKKADQAALTRSLERENQSNPAALIPEQATVFKKATGTTMPPEMITAYKADLEAIDRQKSFQTSYASSHGTSGFRNLPPINRAEAAVQYLTQFHLVANDQLQSLQQAISTVTTDAEANDLANALWGMTGTGAIKRQWDQMIRDAKQDKNLTRARP